jgi:hypothetical protein
LVGWPGPFCQFPDARSLRPQVLEERFTGPALTAIGPIAAPGANAVATAAAQVIESLNADRRSGV